MTHRQITAQLSHHGLGTVVYTFQQDLEMMMEYSTYRYVELLLLLVGLRIAPLAR